MDGRTHPDRADTAAALAAACRAGYHRGKERGAAQWDPLGVTINGVEVLASRSLMHDTLILRLAVPSRTTDIKADELLATSAAGEPGAAKARGLIRRVENLYSGLPAHQKSLTAELEHDQAQLDDLLANPPAPFEHSDALNAKKAELSALTLELRLAAESEHPSIGECEPALAAVFSACVEPVFRAEGGNAVLELFTDIVETVRV